MAATATSVEVKDKEYTNWLSVNLALYYMKSGVHTFIKKEVDCLHQSLVQKIYGGSTVSLPPCTMCHASRVKRDQYGVWAFKKRCRSECDAWLAKLLELHANPKSEEIYWYNSHVPSWPLQPWECAKVFMPRGQQPSNSEPAECDTQALLTLLVNCTHFHPKFSSQGPGLIHTISTIRSKVMHDGEMKLSDADRMSFIQQIIQLLEDPVSLKSLEDCKVAIDNIHKIDNDSLDVDLEMTALRAAVNEFILELGMLKKTTLDNVDSLKREYKQLREQVTKRFEDQRDVPSVKNQTGNLVQQQEKKHQDIHTNVTSHEVGFVADVQNLGTQLQECKTDILTQRGNNSSRKRKAAGKEISDSGTPGKLHRMVLNRCLPALMRDLDFKAVSMYVQQKELFDDMTMCDILEQGVTSDKSMRLIQRVQQGDQDTYEKFKECLVQAKQEYLKDLLEEEAAEVARNQGIETPTKRRPESDGLQQLRNQTEDKLNTLRLLECIPRTQEEEAKKLLEEKRSIVIKGNPGEGKTTMALHLIDNEMYRNRRVVLYYPRQWETVDTDSVDIVMLEDVLGQFDLDPGRLQEWMVHLPTIQEHVDAGKLQVIITTRIDILSKAYSKLESLKLFSDDLSLTLSSEQLTNSEKMNILNRELRRHKRNMKEDEKNKCIANFSGLIGFPQCCSLFARDIKLFDIGPEFFRSPKKLFVANISALEDTRFLSLAFLFCNGKICEEYLSPETMPETSKHLFMELSSHLSKEKADITLLRDAYDSFLELYIVKCRSNDFSLRLAVEKSCIQFTHATICEAVGQVLGERCLEMVVKYGDSEYLYQRTYIAEAKDSTSQNVFIPVSVHGLLAERMVRDVIEKGLARSVVKHSALKQGQFLKTLKGELHIGKRIMDFLMANTYCHQTLSYSRYRSMIFYSNLSEGECITFLEYILQSDEDVVRLVYSEFLEFLKCAHNNNTSGCWLCEEKQKLLELALYYHRFEIADKLINMNACYTRVSLCNAARHDDLRRVQTILETLKRNQAFSLVCYEAKEALYRTYISGNQSMIDLFLEEEITLDSKHLVDVMKHGDVNTLKKVVEHLKCHKNWNPHLEQYRTHQDFFPSHLYSGTKRLHFKERIEAISYMNLQHSILSVRYSGETKRHVLALQSELDEIPFSTALCIAYCNEKFDMADYLLKNEVKVSMHILAYVSKSSSQQAVDRVIQNLKLTGTWDPHCDDASKALEEAYSAHKHDVCDLLTQERVSLTMKNLPGLTERFQVSFESIKKAIQHLKDTDSWDPNCDDASEALKNVYSRQKYDVCDLLVQEGVLLTMKHISGVVLRSLDYVKIAFKQLKDTGSWNPKCDNVSSALVAAYCAQKYDVCDLLIQEGVSLPMKGLCQIIFFGPLESARKAVEHLKDTDSWDPNCDDASKALQIVYRQEKYDVCDMLVHEGVSLTMKHIYGVILRSLDYVKKAMKLLKDTNRWDPKCDDASRALADAYHAQKYDVCNLLIQEGVSLTMNGLLRVVLKGSLESAKKAIQHLKDNAIWDPKCDDASGALESAYNQQKYDVCDLLVQEGVLLTMKSLPGLVGRLMESLESVKKAIQHLKNTDSWDPNCDDASKALANAYSEQKYDVCDLLVQEGVSLTMKSFVGVVGGLMVSWEATKKAIKQLKDTDNWDPKCDDASEALENAYMACKDDVCDLLLKEGVTLKMKHLPGVILRSCDYVNKALKQLKDADRWDPKCDDASEALARAYSAQKYDVCHLLVQEGVSLTMKSLLLVILLGSLESARKAIQHLKDTDSWNPKCDDASEALKKAYRTYKDDVCDLLLQEGVTLTMKHLPAVSFRSLDYVKTIVKQLKDTNRWDHKCNDASKALAKAYSYDKYDVCDLLIQDGVTLTMKNLPHILSKFWVSFESVKKAIQHLKDTNQWNPSSDHAEKLLAETKSRHGKDVHDLLINEGVHYPESDQ